MFCIFFLLFFSRNSSRFVYSSNRFNDVHLAWYPISWIHCNYIYLFFSRQRSWYYYLKFRTHSLCLFNKNNNGNNNIAYRKIISHWIEAKVNRIWNTVSSRFNYQNCKKRSKFGIYSDIIFSFRKFLIIII